MDDQERIAALRRWVDEAMEGARASGSALLGVPPQVLADLLSVLEELTVAEEELRQQNDELTLARRATEAALHKYQDLFEFAPYGYLVTDQAGLIAEANHVVGEILDIEPGFLKGKPLVLHLSHEDRRRLAGLLAELPRRSHPISAEVQLLRRDGTRLPAALTAAVSREGADGARSVRWIVRDLTEERRTKAELARVQSMESLGRLAGGIAHDFNNVLTAAIGTIRQVATLVGDNVEARSALGNAETALLDGAGLAQQLLTFAKGGAPVREVTSLENVILGNAIFAVRGTNVRCEFAVPADLWPADIDPRQIGQVVTNLVLNARQAMPEGGTIRVSAENLAIGSDEWSDLPAGAYVKVSVTDTGAGIPEEHLNHIFDPYFSTRSDGSGLGLAVAASIIGQHSGRITVESELGVGSSFSVYLPATVGEQVRAQTAPAAAARGEGRRVLLVDDEVLIAMSYGGLLRQAGYEVVTAAAGATAVARYREAMEQGKPFDIVVMDLTLPGGIGGQEATRQILQLDPGACVVVSSGYSTASVMANYREHGFSGVLAKPYTLEGLLGVVSHLPPRGGCPRASRSGS